MTLYIGTDVPFLLCLQPPERRKKKVKKREEEKREKKLILSVKRFQDKRVHIFFVKVCFSVFVL